MLLLGGAALAGAQTEGSRRLLLDASRALQAGSAARFFSYFDREKVADWPTLRESVLALTEQRTIASSIEIVSSEEDETATRVDVDWLLQITPRDGLGPVERRRETLRVKVEPRGRELKITSIEPIQIFSPY